MHCFKITALALGLLVAGSAEASVITANTIIQETLVGTRSGSTTVYLADGFVLQASAGQIGQNSRFEECFASTGTNPFCLFTLPYVVYFNEVTDGASNAKAADDRGVVRRLCALWRRMLPGQRARPPPSAKLAQSNIADKDGRIEATRRWSPPTPPTATLLP